MAVLVEIRGGTTPGVIHVVDALSAEARAGRLCDERSIAEVLNAQIFEMCFGALAHIEGDGPIAPHRFLCRSARGFAPIVDERTNDVEVEEDFDLVPLAGSEGGGRTDKRGG